MPDGSGSLIRVPLKLHHILDTNFSVKNKLEQFDEDFLEIFRSSAIIVLLVDSNNHNDNRHNLISLVPRNNSIFIFLKYESPRKKISRSRRNATMLNTFDPFPNSHQIVHFTESRQFDDKKFTRNLYPDAFSFHRLNL